MKESVMPFHGYLRFNIKRIILLFFLSFSLLIGGSGLTVLSLPEDPSGGWFPIARGDLATAVSQPVFLPEDQNTWQATHSFWMFDTPYSRIIGGSKSFFAGASFLQTGGIEIRTDVATDEPIGETAYYNGTLFMGKEWILRPGLRVGAVSQLVFERLYHASALGGALNLAGACQVNSNTVAVVGVRNLGIMQDLYKNPTPLPLDLYAGLSASVNGAGTGIAIHLDETGTFYGTGRIEYVMQDLLSAAFSYSGINNSWHIGAKIHYKQVTFGVGQFFMQDQIAYPFMLSIGYISDKK
jgi:hypothetical protein